MAIKPNIAAHTHPVQEQARLPIVHVPNPQQDHNGIIKPTTAWNGSSDLDEWLPDSFGSQGSTDQALLHQGIHSGMRPSLQ